MTGDIYDLLDDKPEIEKPYEDDLYGRVQEENEFPPPQEEGQRSGLSPFQWFLLSFLFFVGVCFLTVMVLLVAGRIMPP